MSEDATMNLASQPLTYCQMCALCCSKCRATFQLNAKSYCILILAVTFTSCLFLWNPHTPRLRSIVEKTHKKISSLRQDVHDKVNTMLSRFSTDWTYLKKLGFTDSPRLYNDTLHRSDRLPVVITAVSGTNDIHDLTPLIKSIHSLHPKLPIVVWGLDLSKHETEELQLVCNETSSGCSTREFEYDDLPKHVRDWKLGAYKPVIIQQALNEFGGVWWTTPRDILERPVSPNTIQTGRRVGVAGWKISNPTSAWTHERVFEYFQTSKSKFYFHHMVEAHHLIIFNTGFVHKKVMLPWLQCAFTSHCINPRGAQDKGCIYARKPMYEYSNCHAYTASVLNVVLGLAFDGNIPYAVGKPVFKSHRDFDLAHVNVTSVTDTEWHLIG